MSALLIIYDTKSPWLDYGGLVRAIKKFDWIKLTDTSYAISTSITPQEVFELLRKSLDDSANLYVLSLKKPFTGFGPPRVNEWLVRHLRE